MIISPIISLWIFIPITIILLVLIILSSKKIKLVIRILILVLIFVINLRIKVYNGNVTVFNNNLDIIFVVDTTLSMDALDYNGNNSRLEAVKKDLEYIINEIPGASYSVLSFDTQTFVNLPLTTDANSVIVSIRTLKVPDSLYARGSSITIFKDDLRMILESASKKDNRKSVVFIVTDGENTTDEKLESLSNLKKYIDGGAVLGYGTTSGGRILVETYTGSGQYEYLKDRSTYPYKDAVSVIDENNLKKMAKDLGLDYIHMTKQNAIDKKIKEINDTKDLSDSDEKYSYSDIYYYFSPILIGLFAMELFIDRRMFK